MKLIKQKLRILIPLLTVGGILIYSSIIFLSTDTFAPFRYYLAIILLPVPLLLTFKNEKRAIAAGIIYLLIGTCNLISFTPAIVSSVYGIRIFSAEIWTPSFQIISFGILILFCILNIDALIDLYLDYKEHKAKKQ